MKNIYFCTYKDTLLGEKRRLFRIFLRSFFFELLLKHSDFLNSDDCIEKISRYIRSNPNFDRSLWRNCKIPLHYTCILSLSRKFKLIHDLNFARNHRLIWQLNNWPISDPRYGGRVKWMKFLSAVKPCAQFSSNLFSSNEFSSKVFRPIHFVQSY